MVPLCHQYLGARLKTVGGGKEIFPEEKDQNCAKLLLLFILFATVFAAYSDPLEGGL